MGSDRRQDTYDPRYDGIYQRGGESVTAGPVTSPASPAPVTAPAAAAWSRAADPSSERPGRGGAAAERSAAGPAGPSRPEASPAGVADIRDIGPEPVVHPGSSGQRNPFDLVLWIVAAILVALGAYFLAAPMLYEEAYRERYLQDPSLDPYTMPWFNYTVTAAPPLILVGAATAVVQLLVLSLRHTLRQR
jgi:hypothetical protein